MKPLKAMASTYIMAAGNSTATEGSTEYEHIVKDTIACSRLGIEP